MKQIILHVENVKELLALSDNDRGIVFKALLRHMEGLVHTEHLGDPDEIIKPLIKLNANDLNGRKLRFGKLLAAKLPNEDKKMLREFYDYWTEHGEFDKKMRFEKEGSFGIGRRFGTWKSNQSKFNATKGADSTEGIILKTRMGG